MTELDARVPCTTETRDELRRLKDDDDRRYEDVLRRLVREHKDKGND